MSMQSSKPRVFAALPGTATAIAKRTSLTESTVRRHLCTLRSDGEAHIKSRRRTAGGPTSVWVAGPGIDAAPLKQVPGAISCRKHKARVRKAVAFALAGGREDPRYIRHIASKQVTVAVRATRAAPQCWFSALIQPKEGSAC